MRSSPDGAGAAASAGAAAAAGELILFVDADSRLSAATLRAVLALMAGAGWLGEPVTPGLLAALALVAAGIVLVNRKPAAA